MTEGNAFHAARMSENAQILLVIWGFWITVVVLDVIAIFRVRSLALPPVAAVLWTVWIILAPIVGAVSSFIVATSSDKLAESGVAAARPLLGNTTKM